VLSSPSPTTQFVAHPLVTGARVLVFLVELAGVDCGTPHLVFVNEIASTAISPR